jgi:hypothetical protein
MARAAAVFSIALQISEEKGASQGLRHQTEERKRPEITQEEKSNRE